MMISEIKDIRRKIQRAPLFAGEPQTLAELFRQAQEKRSRKDALNYKSGSEWKAICIL